MPTQLKLKWKGTPRIIFYRNAVCMRANDVCVYEFLPGWQCHGTWYSQFVWLLLDTPRYVVYNVTHFHIHLPFVYLWYGDRMPSIRYWYIFIYVRFIHMIQCDADIIYIYIYPLLLDITNRIHISPHDPPIHTHTANKINAPKYRNQPACIINLNHYKSHSYPL